MSSLKLRHIVQGAKGAFAVWGTWQLAKQTDQLVKQKLKSGSKGSMTLPDEESDSQELTKEDVSLPDKDLSSAAKHMERDTQQRRLKTRVLDDVTIRTKFMAGTAQDIVDEIESRDYSIVHEDLKCKLEDSISQGGSSVVMVSLSIDEIAVLYDIGVGHVKGPLKVI